MNMHCQSFVNFPLIHQILTSKEYDAMSKEKVASFDPHGSARNKEYNQNFKASEHYKEIRDKSKPKMLLRMYAIKLTCERGG